MAIINSDIIIRGKHARIVNCLIENKVYNEGFEVFIDSCFLGLYHGQRSDIDTSSNDKVEISRTIWERRRELENSLFVFLQHEKYLQHQPLDTAEVFNMNLNTVDTKTLLEELKEYAYFGIEKLEEMFNQLGSNTTVDSLIQFSEENIMKTTEEIDIVVDKYLDGLSEETDDQHDVDSLINFAKDSFPQGGL